MYVKGPWLKDGDGRTLILRGANLGGSTKLPFNKASYEREGFFEHRDVSFVGRPFPLEEADEHFTRLKAWGMSFLRFLVTWEAVEHAGPGQYDEAYLDYLHAVVQKAAEYDISCFIDPHQDVWSRWTGGDGAPGWTLEAIGMDISKLHQVGAAITHATHGDPFPRMIWPTNYSKLGAATMFTLFFAGDDYAPETKIDGVPVQEYLQSHYINAMKQIAMCLRDLDNVVGFDTLNEPGRGYIGVDDLSAPMPGLLTLGHHPTPYQSMLLAAGYPQKVPIMEMSFPEPEQTGTATLNPDGVCLWRGGYEGVWRENGLWTDEGGEPKLLRPDHFAGADFSEDYLKPFLLRYTEEIRSIIPDAIIFLEGEPGGDHPHWGADDPDNVVNATHWYDGLTLFTKQFNPEFSINPATGEPVSGREAVAMLFRQQLAGQKSIGLEQMGGIPTLIGEFGIPFDLDDKSAYESGDFSTHEYALDLYYDAMDANLLNCTIWNYTADNTNARGDQWNDEDLSIFSRDQQKTAHEFDIHSGGRGLRAVVRPYARCVAGEPLRMHFDMETRVFELEIKHDAESITQSEIFVPLYQYPDGFDVEISDGVFAINKDEMIVRVSHTQDREIHTVRITPA